MKIFIIGLMGSGKSHTGKKLAEKLGFDFIDLDHYIETNQAKTISEIFDQQGEQKFRAIEQFHLLELVERKNTVIATGGGTPCFFQNMKFMNDHGLTIYLRTPTDLLIKRLFNELENRPLVKEMNTKELKQFLEIQLKERLPFYESAQLIYFQEDDGQNIENELIDRLDLLKHSISDD